jgi:hypothetical protein
MNKILLALSFLFFLFISIESFAGDLEKPTTNAPPVPVPPALRLAVPEAAESCSSIHDDDLENLCKGSCSSIHDDDLENACKGSCSSIHDDDLENACKGGSSCSSIHDDDLENLCKGQCTSIRDNDLENLCKGQCTSIRDDDLENACKAHLSRRARVAAGWWFQKHKH